MPRAPGSQPEPLSYPELMEEAARQQLLARASRVFSEAQLDFTSLLQSVAREIATSFSDGCSVSLLSPDGEWLDVVAHAHVDPEAEEMGFQIAAASRQHVGQGLVGRVVQEGRTILVPHVSQEQLLASVKPEYRAFFERHPVRSLLIAPIRARGRVIGTIQAGRSQMERAFTPADQSLLEELADRAGLSIENARLLQRAEAGQARAAFLGEISRTLAESLDPEAALRQLTELCVPTLADWCTVSLSEEGSPLRRVAARHRDERRRASAEELERRFPPHLHRDGRLVKVLQTGKAELISAVPDTALAAAAQDAEHLALMRALGVGSTLLVPLTARGRVLGVISLVRGKESPALGPAELELAEEVASRAAIAADNALLLRAARHAQEQHRQVAERLKLLADMTHVLAAAPLERSVVLETVVREVSRQLADAAGLYLLSEDGTQLLPKANYHPVPEAQAAIREMMTRTPLALGEGLLGGVAMTGRSLLVPRVDPQAFLASLKPEYRPILERFPAVSFMVVPVRVRGRIAGTLGASRHGSSPPFTPEDLLLLEEITDRAGLMLGKAQLLEEARAAVKVRDEFLSVASHELKTPLTSLGLQVELMLRTLSPESKKKGTPRLEAIHRQLGRLSSLVESLLDVSRISAGRLELELEDVDLSALVREVVARFELEAERAACTLHVTLQEALVGRWDKLRLEQVVSNLLSNAIKYGAGKPIHLRVEPREGQAVLLVRDEGIGMTSEALRRIFNRFERAVSGRNYGGLGLGLYITRQLLEAMGGTVTAQSEPGAGSTFTVVLPLRVGTSTA